MKALLAGLVFMVSTHAFAATNADLCLDRAGKIAQTIRSISVWDVTVEKVEYKGGKKIGQQTTGFYEVTLNSGTVDLHLGEFCNVLAYNLK